MLFRALVCGHICGATACARWSPCSRSRSGVAIALAIDLANATAVASFASSVNVIANHVNLQVLGVGRGFDERTMLRVQARRRACSLRSPADRRTRSWSARAPGDPFSGEILRVLGVDLLRPLPHDAVAAVATPGGVAPRATQRRSVTCSINGHGAFVIAARRDALSSARRAATLRRARRRPAGALAGRAVFPPRVAGVDSSVVFVDIATAQEIFGKVGRLDRIDCVVDPARLPAVTARGRGACCRRARARSSRRCAPARSSACCAASSSTSPRCRTSRCSSACISSTTRSRSRSCSAGPRSARCARSARRAAQIFRAFLAEGALFGVVGSLLGLALGCRAGAVLGRRRLADRRHALRRHARRPRRSTIRCVLLKAFVVGVARRDALGDRAGARSGARRRRRWRCARRLRAAHRRGFAARRALGGSRLFAARAALLTRLPAIDDDSGLRLRVGLAASSPAARSARRSRSSGVSRLGAPRVRDGVSAAAELAAGEPARVAAPQQRRGRVADGRDRDDGQRRDPDRLVPHDGRRVGRRNAASADSSCGRSALHDAIDRRALLAARAATRSRAVPGVAAVDTFRAITIPFRGAHHDARRDRSSARSPTRNKLRFLGVADTRSSAPARLPGTDDVARQRTVRDPL